MNDWPARIDPEEAAIGRPTATARHLVDASVSENTRRAYAGALRRLDVLARRPRAPRCGRLPRRAARLERARRQDAQQQPAAAVEAVTDEDQRYLVATHPVLGGRSLPEHGPVSISRNARTSRT